MPGIANSWRTGIDLLTLYLISYGLLSLVKLVRAFRIAGALALVYGVSIAAWHLGLPITARMLQVSALLLLGFLVIVFQPEIRRSLVKLDLASVRPRTGHSTPHAPSCEIADAVFEMAGQKTGALIVVLTSGLISDLVDGGVPLHADVSAALLRSIFQKTSPLHDGAVIVERDRITWANVVVPLTERHDVPAPMGTRHRAGMGVTERIDCIAVVVSEDRGEVTVMEGGTCEVVGNRTDLLRRLQARRHFRTYAGGRTLVRRLFLNWKLKAAAAAFSIGMVAGADLINGSSVRILTVPVEYVNLPQRVDVADESSPTVEVQVRGKGWLMDESGLDALTVRLDLHGRRPGLQKIKVDERALEMPPGVRLIRVIPNELIIRLELRPTH